LEFPASPIHYKKNMRTWLVLGQKPDGTHTLIAGPEVALADQNQIRRDLIAAGCISDDYIRVLFFDGEPDRVVRCKTSKQAAADMEQREKDDATLRATLAAQQPKSRRGKPTPTS
jgi:hypothetical protein